MQRGTRPRAAAQRQRPTAMSSAVPVWLPYRTSKGMPGVTDLAAVGLAAMWTPAGRTASCTHTTHSSNIRREKRGEDNISADRPARTVEGVSLQRFVCESLEIFAIQMCQTACCDQPLRFCQFVPLVKFRAEGFEGYCSFGTGTSERFVENRKSIFQR